LSVPAGQAMVASRNQFALLNDRLLAPLDHALAPRNDPTRSAR